MANSMELIRGIHNLRPRHRGCVVTIGNFDGVHRGHAILLRRVQERAAEMGLPACVVTFEPHSKEFLSPETAPTRLTDLRGKVAALRCYRMERLLVLPFNRQLAALEPDDFIDRVLVAGLGVRHLVVGQDFAFGRLARGGLADLKRKGAVAGFEAEGIPELWEGGQIVGSTAIRMALAEGDLVTAERLLGRPYSIHGRVVRGDGLGHRLGFPTANLHTHHPSLPVAGIFAGEVRAAGLVADYPAAVSIGHRPAVGGSREQIEAYLLGFDGDLYYQILEVVLRKRFRSEQPFQDLTSLRGQIAEDVARVREYFAHPSPGSSGSK